MLPDEVTTQVSAVSDALNDCLQLGSSETSMLVEKQLR